MLHIIDKWQLTPTVQVDHNMEVSVAGQAADMRFTLEYDTAEDRECPWIVRVWGLKTIETNEWEVWTRRLTNPEAGALVFLFVNGDTELPGRTVSADCYDILTKVLEGLPQHLRMIP